MIENGMNELRKLQVLNEKWLILRKNERGMRPIKGSLLWGLIKIIRYFVLVHTIHNSLWFGPKFFISVITK